MPAMIHVRESHRGRAARDRARLSPRQSASAHRAGRPTQSEQSTSKCKNSIGTDAYILRVAGKEANIQGAGMTKNKDAALMPVERITRSILNLRRHRVLLD